MTAQLSGPDRPVPYSLTPKAEAALAGPAPEPGPDPEIEAEIEADWADEWDSADSDRYQARVGAGLELEAEL